MEQNYIYSENFLKGLFIFKDIRLILDEILTFCEYVS